MVLSLHSPKGSAYRTRNLFPYMHHCLPILKATQLHSQNNFPTHKEAKWHPRASQSKVPRAQSPVPHSYKERKAQRNNILWPPGHTRQPSPRPCITHLHQAAFWSGHAPVPLGSRETLPTVLSTAPCVDFSVPGQHCHMVISTWDLLHRVGKKEIQLQGFKHFRAISFVNTNASVIVRAKGIHLALIWRTQGKLGQHTELVLGCILTS